MPFRLVEVKTDAEFEKMMPSFWTALNNPRNVLRELMFPVNEGLEAEAIKDCKSRFLSSWHENPVGHYIQILDENKDDVVVGSAYWSFFDNEHNPFLEEPKGDPDSVTWWPAGSEIQRYTKMAIDQGQIPKFEMQKRPHFYLGMCYIDPAYRRRGVARMLMDWGTERSDELGVECFLDATVIGVPLYKSCEFLLINETPLIFEIENPSVEWKELQKNYPLHPQINMWRPVGGKHNEGEKYPWED